MFTIHHRNALIDHEVWCYGKCMHEESEDRDVGAATN